MDLANYRDRAREFQTELCREKYSHHAGLRDELAVEPIYKKFRDLFADAAVTELSELHRNAPPDDEKPLRYLLCFAVDHALNSEVFAEDQQIARALSKHKIKVGGKEYSFHQAAVQVANEQDRDRREQILQLRLTPIDQVNGLRIARLEKIQAKAKKLFGGSLVDLYQKLSRVNFEVLKTQLENFLVASESYYSSRIERYGSKVLGEGVGTVRACDVPYLLRGHAYDSLFPSDRLLSLLKRTLMGLGVDLKKQRNVVIDSADRANKSSLAHCFPVRVPEEVNLVLLPQGGVFDFLTLFHEAGHALHYGFTAETESFEYRFLGDPAVGETYGFLFEYLALNEDWLQDFLKVKPGETDFLDNTQFRKLYLLRRYAARFLFELVLHERSSYTDRDLPDIYASTLNKALHLQVEPRMYLHDMEDAFSGTRFLRAWIFEAELRQILIDRFGARWYSRPAAGDFLKDLWRFGFRYDCDELAARIRSFGLNLDPITREVQA